MSRYFLKKYSIPPSVNHNLDISPLEKEFLKMYHAAHFKISAYGTIHAPLKRWPMVFEFAKDAPLSVEHLLHCLRYNPGHGFLWSLDEERACLILYEDSMIPLKELFETHRLSRETATHTRKALALAHHHMWTSLLCFEGAWLTKYRHPHLDGMLGDILFTTAYHALKKSGAATDGLFLMAKLCRRTNWLQEIRN